MITKNQVRGVQRVGPFVFKTESFVYGARIYYLVFHNLEVWLYDGLGGVGEVWVKEYLLRKMWRKLGAA